MLSVFNSSKEKTGRKSFIVVTGESGSGKKKLVDEFKIHCQLTNHDFYRIDFTGKPDPNNSEPIKNLVVSIAKIIRNNKPDMEVIDKLFDDPENNIRPEDLDHTAKTVSAFVNDASPNNALVVAVNNIEFADKGSLEFISYILNRFYKNLNLFFVITVNPRKVRDNRKTVHSIINAPNEERLLLHLPNLNLEQIKKIVNTYFSNLRDVPEFFYSKLQNVTGNSIKRLIDILKMLYAKNIIVKTFSGYSYQASTKFEPLLNEFISSEINFNPANLSSEELSVLKALSVALVPVTHQNLAEITDLSQADVKDIIDRIYETFFIRMEGGDPYYFSITEDILKRMILKTCVSDEIKYFHRKISSIVFKDVQTQETTKRLYRFIHNLAGHKNIEGDLDEKIEVVKLGLLKSRDLSNLIEFYSTMIYKIALPDKIKLKLLYEVIYIIFKNLVPETNQHFIEEYRSILSHYSDKDFFGFETDMIELIDLNYSENIDTAAAIVEKNRIYLNDKTRRAVLLDLMIYVMHQSYNHKKEYYYLDELLKFTENNPNMKTVNQYLSMYDTYNRKSERYKDEPKIFEQMLLDSFNLLKNSDDKPYAARAYIIMGFWYEKQDYSEEIERFFQKAFEFYEDNRFPVFIFFSRHAYSAYLERHNMLRKAVDEANKAFVFDVNYSFLFSIINLIEQRSEIRIKLEDPIQEIINDLVMLINIETGVKESIGKVYRNIIELYYEAGKFNDMTEYLTSYIMSMNSRKRGENTESLSFYIRTFLKNYTINEIFDSTKQYFAEMAITEDRFLDLIYSIREDMQTQPPKENKTITNDYLIDIINRITDGKPVDFDEIHKLMDSSDSNSPVFARTNLFVSLHYNKDYTNTVNQLLQNLVMLYGKGYSNTAQKLATALAKYLFYVKQDNNSFLSYTKLSLKINGEIFINSPQNIKNAIQKDPDIRLLREMIKNIKMRYKI
jgi:hypothetical protein